MRHLLTPEGALPYEPANLGAALNLLHEATTRDAPPDLGPGYPRIEARHGQWCRQNIVGGHWWPIPLPELRELLGIDEVA